MKYSELYPSSLTEGIGLISGISNQTNCPWNALSVEEKASLEKAYYVRSHFKTVIDSFVLAGGLSQSMLLLAMFGQKWSKLWNDFSKEYDPLHAYIVEETGNRDKQLDGTQTDNFGREVKVDGTDTGTVKNETVDSLTGSNGIYGFNSTTMVPSDTQTEATNSSDTETRDLTNSTNTVNSGSDSRTTSDTENEQYSLTKKGNIGYSTPQKLLSEDIELWKTAYFDIVFSDIDDFIMVAVYDI